MEKLVKELLNPLGKLKEKIVEPTTPAMVEYSRRIGEIVGKQIYVKPGKGGGGKLSFDFQSEEDLRKIMLSITGGHA